MPISIAGSGTITGISAGGLPDGVITTDDIAAAAVTSAKLATGAGGKILQVVQTTKTDTTSTTSTSFSDLTGMSVSITPASTSNKVLIVVQLGGVSSASFTVLFNLVRGTNTNLAQPDAGTNKASMNIYTNSAAPGGHSLVWLDSPSSITSLTYKLQWRVDQGTGFFNRHSGSADYSSVSTITALEVAA